MHTLLLAIVFLTIIGLFWQRWQQLSNDANSSPTDLTFGEWAKHTAIEFGFNVLAFIAYCLGVNVSLGEQVATQATDGATQAQLLTITAAIASGVAIYKFVQVTLLPLWNGLTGAITARKLLRNKVEDAQLGEKK